MGIFKLEGDYEFLSLEYPHPIMVDGISYPNALRAFAACRFKSEDQRELCINCNNEVLNYIVTVILDGPLVKDDFRGNMSQYLYRVLAIKFSDEELCAKLKSLKNEKIIVLGSNTVLYKNNDRGVNLLGKILMRLRDDLLKDF